MRRYLLTLSLAFFAMVTATAQDKTYCNPIDLDYGWGGYMGPKSRTSADPVVVLFKDKYYLFTTVDTGGYRVSDDLMNWRTVHFGPQIASEVLASGIYVAPAVAADDKYMYFIKLNRNRKEKTVNIIRSSDPESGKWEICGTIPRVSDPTMYIDKGRYFIFHGLGADQSIKCFELDPKTMSMIPNSENLMLDYITDVNKTKSGYHFGRRELWDEIDAKAWKGRHKALPCTEGAWVVKNNGKYYMQYATPGTICIWYSDVVMVSDRPDGGYVEMPYNPVSLKAGGFIGSAGHSSVFQDKFGNWWEATTMWIGTNHPFERRIGLFPVSFDAKGRMRVHTLFGDYPMTIPQRKFTVKDYENLASWWALSPGKKCTVSSTLEGFPAKNASDEDVRTWWSSRGGKGEWLEMDLGGVKDIRALQINFAEVGWDTTRFAKEDYWAYRVEATEDGINWSVIVDKSKNTTTNPHDYVDLGRSVKASKVKIICEKSASGCTFAIRDLRLFGSGMGQLAPATKRVSVVRDRKDERYADLKWDRVAHADGYMVRFGIAPDFLNLAIQVKGNATTDLQLHLLTKGYKYYYRVDSYNENGVTHGKIIND